MGLLADSDNHIQLGKDISRRTSWDDRDDQDHSGFFVHPDECLFCAQCQRVAPTHFEFSEDRPKGEAINSASGDAFSKVIRQPKTAEELRVVIEAVDECMCDCIYYGGNDPKVEKALRDSKVDPVVLVRATGKED